MILEALLGAVAVLAAALAVTAVSSYRRTRDGKLAFVAAAFGVFASKAALWEASLFIALLDGRTLAIVVAAADLAILVVLFAATLRP